MRNSNYCMNPIERERCKKFFYALPDFPNVANAGYDPIDDVILLPVTIEKDSPLYFQQIAHEYFHKKLYQFDVRNIVDSGDPDFTIFEEVACEFGAVVILNHLGIFNEVQDQEINYIRQWKGYLNNKALLREVFPLVKQITKNMGIEISKNDLPIHLRVLMGLF